MHRGALYTLLFSLGLTALAPSIAHAASEGGQPAEIGKLLNERLSTEAADDAQKEQAALAKGKRLALLAEGNAILKDIDTLQGTIERWESQTKALLTNAEGQALATDPVNVQHFANLQNAERYPLSQVEGARGEVQSVLTPIQTASDSSLYTPSDTLVTAMRTAGKQVKDALAQYQGFQNKLKVLLQTSKGVPVNADSPTLAVALQKLAEEQAQRAWEEEQAAKNRADHIIQEAQEEQALERARAERDRIRREGELERQRQEHELLLKEAGSEVVVQRFAPFLAKAENVLKAPNGGKANGGLPNVNGYWPLVSGNPESLSYSALNQWGALSDVKMFTFIALEYYNPRPKGDFKQPLTEAEWKKMQQRLDEFNRYAAAWQELGLLKP